MRALASSFSAWHLLEQQEGTKVPHGLVYSLAVVESIGRPHGLELVAEETLVDRSARAFDAVFISVLDSRCMVGAAEHFDRWGLALDRRSRSDSDPLVWAGGQGLANPRPFDLIADLIVIGDAEQPLPALLELWHSGARGQAFLELAAAVPGVYVPSVHDPARDRVRLSVSEDIGASLRDEISVSLDGTRRIEITLRTYYALTAPADVGASESPEPEPMFFQCCVPPTAAANGYCFDKPPSAPCPEGSKLHICSDEDPELDPEGPALRDGRRCRVPAGHGHRHRAVFALRAQVRGARPQVQVLHRNRARGRRQPRQRPVTRGGEIVLFPARGNTYHDHITEPLSVVYSDLAALGFNP